MILHAAILLAASGIFAVLAHAVAGRTREFGLRIALGADAPRVVRDVLREGMAFPLAGIVAGIAASFAVTRLLRASLYAISPQEPGVLLSTAALLAAVAAAACIVPAWRATRADPMSTLSED